MEKVRKELLGGDAEHRERRQRGEGERKEDGAGKLKSGHRDSKSVDVQ